MIGDQASRALTLLSGIRLCGSAPDPSWEEFWPGLVTRVIFDLDESGNAAGVSLVTGLLAEMWDHLAPRPAPAEEYEMACTRMEQATAALDRARKAREAGVLAAEAEYTAATRHLAAFESSPGIPRPEFDPLRPGPDGARDGDRDILSRLVVLWGKSGWMRLEVHQVDRRISGGDCVNDHGKAVRAERMLVRPECPSVLTDLARLLRDSGWQSLEVNGRPGQRSSANGYGRRADGSELWFTYPGPDGYPAVDKRPS